MGREMIRGGGEGRRGGRERERTIKGRIRRDGLVVRIK